MSPPLPTVRAVLFDAYGTLFDVYSIGVAAERRFPSAGERLAVLWRDKQIEYTRLSSMSGRPRSFRDCTRAGLRFAARRLALALDAAGEDELMACYDRLDPFPENRGVLDGARVLAPKTVELMTSVQTMADPYRWSLAWGVGLMLVRSGDRIYCGHDGGMPGYLANVLVDRDSGLGGHHAALHGVVAALDPGKVHEAGAVARGRIRRGAGPGRSSGAVPRGVRMAGGRPGPPRHVPARKFARPVAEGGPGARERRAG